MDKSQNNNPEKPGNVIMTKLEYVIPDTLPTFFVTNAVIQHLDHEFVIGFYNIRTPILLTDEDKATAKEIKTVKATCSAQICVSPERLEKFVEIFQQQLKRYHVSLGKKQAKAIKQPKETNPLLPDKTSKTPRKTHDSK